MIINLNKKEKCNLSSQLYGSCLKLFSNSLSKFDEWLERNGRQIDERGRGGG